MRPSGSREERRVMPKKLFVHGATTMGVLESDGAEGDAVEGPEDRGIDGKHGRSARTVRHEGELTKGVARFAFGDLATAVLVASVTADTESYPSGSDLMNNAAILLQYK
jgi:hypothetical protein